MHSRERLHTTVEAFLERVLLMPTLMVIEDIHWLDDGSRFLLHHLVRAAAPRPWLVCVTTRPAAETIVLPGGHGTRIELQPLSAESGEALALAVAQEHALSTDAVASLAARAGGNPLFLRELVFAARHGAPEELPESVETLLTTRIDTLAPADRLLLRFASVVGPTFRLELLGAILGDEVEGAGESSRWDSLGEFVVPLEAGMLGFRHDLVRATAYEGLSFRRRREIHERVGLALEQRAGDRADEEAALLSFHFAEAGDDVRAWRYGTAAGAPGCGGIRQRGRRGAPRAGTGGRYGAGTLPPEEVAGVAELLGDVCERFGGLRPCDGGVRTRPRGRCRTIRSPRLVSWRSAARFASASVQYDDAMRVYEEGLDPPRRTSRRAGARSQPRGDRPRRGGHPIPAGPVRGGAGVRAAGRCARGADG